ncbi:hypothetical protein C7212DRAFT_160906 [Tuber magnatum]|uniref:Uncharacterized protein n=1 Tax=Tuber magnatum TaxID=42249 RepID=A0A317T290_9PEZI|nr:hypothetical protein C7212DRAFT_160906 [Tuber magnatum]
MADVRKLLQAERRKRDANNKNTPAAPPPRTSGKRPFSENSGSSSKRTKTSASATANLPSDFFSGDPVSSSSNERVEVQDPRSSKPTAAAATDDDPMPEAKTSLPQDFFQKNSMEDIDEDEWAAFQAEVVAESSSAPTPGVPPAATVITAAPTLNSATGGQEQRIDDEDDYGKGEEEDAKQKLLDEFEEMESLEQRVLRLKERREALKSKHPITGTRMAFVEVEVAAGGEPDDNDDDDEYEEDDFFRARGS